MGQKETNLVAPGGQVETIVPLHQASKEETSHVQIVSSGKKEKTSSAASDGQKTARPVVGETEGDRPCCSRWDRKTLVLLI